VEKEIIEESWQPSFLGKSYRRYLPKGWVFWDREPRRFDETGYSGEGMVFFPEKSFQVQVEGAQLKIPKISMGYWRVVPKNKHEEEEFLDLLSKYVKEEEIK